MPKDFQPGEKPEGMEPPEGMDQGERPEPPDGFDPDQIPEDFQPGQMPNDMKKPEGGEIPAGEANSQFFMQDKVNFFSGLTEA